MIYDTYNDASTENYEYYHFVNCEEKILLRIIIIGKCEEFYFISEKLKYREQRGKMKGREQFIFIEK